MQGMPCCASGKQSGSVVIGRSVPIVPLISGYGRLRHRISFSSAQRLARAAVLLGGWDAALRVGLGSRGVGAASVLLRGACGKNDGFGRLGVASAVVRWRRREGEEGRRWGVGVVVEIAAGAALALATASVAFAAAAAAAASGDGGRTGGDVRRFRGRAGIGLDR